MALPREFRLREGVALRSDQTGVRWEVMVSGRMWCQLRSLTETAVSMRLPTEQVRAIFSPAEAVV